MRGPARNREGKPLARFGDLANFTAFLFERHIHTKSVHPDEPTNAIRQSTPAERVLIADDTEVRVLGYPHN